MPCLGQAPQECPLPGRSTGGLHLCFFTSACRPVLNAPAKALRSAASHEDRGPHPPRLSMINTVSGTQDVVEEIGQSTPSAKLHCNKDVKNQLDRTLGSSELEWELGSGLSPAPGCQPTSTGPAGSPSPGLLIHREDAGLRPQGINTAHRPRCVQGTQRHLCPSVREMSVRRQCSVNPRVFPLGPRCSKLAPGIQDG